jgi:hypothetical protein
VTFDVLYGLYYSQHKHQVNNSIDLLGVDFVPNRLHTKQILLLIIKQRRKTKEKLLKIEIS